MRDAACSAASALEHGPHRVRLEQLLLRERPHRAAPIRLVVDAAELLEIAQRLAHRRLAALQLARDLRLHEPLARRVRPGHDALEDVVLDLVAQERLVERAGSQSAARRERLQHRAHGIQLREIRLGELAHRAPAVGLVVDAAQLLELAQRLPHRRLAALQLARDLRLDEPLTRRVRAREDALQDELLHLVAQNDLLQRAHGASPRAVDTRPRYQRAATGHGLPGAARQQQREQPRDEHERDRRPQARLEPLPLVEQPGEHRAREPPDGVRHVVEADVHRDLVARRRRRG